MTRGPHRRVHLAGWGLIGPVEWERAAEVDPLAELDLPLTPRQRRYLTVTGRWAVAAAARALRRGGLTPGPGEAHRDSSAGETAVYIAAPRGPCDETASREIAEAGKRDGIAGAIEAYRKRRPHIQYLLSMEPAPLAHLTTLFSLRGPAHTVTAPGAAGGMQAIARALHSVADGRSPAALAVAVSAFEEERRYAAWCTRLEGTGLGLALVAAALLFRPAGGERESVAEELGARASLLVGVEGEGIAIPREGAERSAGRSGGADPAACPSPAAGSPGSGDIGLEQEGGLLLGPVRPLTSVIRAAQAGGFPCRVLLQGGWGEELDLLLTEAGSSAAADGRGRRQP